MSCKKTRKLILTDYLDGEMDAKARARIEEHLAQCAACKEFSLAAKSVGGELFSGASRADVPEYVWRRIRENIMISNEAKTGMLERLFEKLRYLLYMIPRPALAVASVVALMLAIGTVTTVMVNNRPVVKMDMLAQTEYFDYLTKGPVDSTANSSAEFGTTIEKYFL